MPRWLKDLPSDEWLASREAMFGMLAALGLLALLMICTIDAAYLLALLALCSRGL